MVLVRPSARFRYDDETLSLVLSEGEPEIELDVESLVFMGLMNGRLPDHVLAVALEEAVARLSRLVRYRDELGGLPEARVRFAGTRPVVLVGDRLVVDPAGESFLASGARPGEAASLVRAAVEDPLRT